MSVRPSDRQVPVSSETNAESRSNKDHRSIIHYTLLFLAIVIVILDIILIVYVSRHDKDSKTTIIQEHSPEEREKMIYNNCIDLIWATLLDQKFDQSKSEFLQPIQIKVFNTLRYLTPTYKQDLILFLYERGLIRTDISTGQKPLDLHDADLKNIQFENLDLDYLYLPRVIATNSRFSNCQLKRSNFQGSIMDNTHFIASVLNESTFSGASLKRTTFTENTGLSTVDFTSADLFESRINTSEHSDKKLIVNTRLPDGSFPNIDSKNLVNDGGAEDNCDSLKTDHWSTEPPHLPLEIAYRNESCVTIKSATNNYCYFQGNSTSRLIQDIDLTPYSALIDANQAWFNLTGSMGCANTASSRDYSTIEIHFGNERKFYEKYPPHVMKSKKSWQSFRNDSLIPIGTRSVRITITVTKDKNSPACCGIDDVRFHILHNTETNITFI